MDLAPGGPHHKRLKRSWPAPKNTIVTKSGCNWFFSDFRYDIVGCVGKILSEIDGLRRTYCVIDESFAGRPYLLSRVQIPATASKIWGKFAYDYSGPGRPEISHPRDTLSGGRQPTAAIHSFESLDRSSADADVRKTAYRSAVNVVLENQMLTPNLPKISE